MRFLTALFPPRRIRVIAPVALAALIGCATSGSTRITIDDYEYVAAEISEKLRASLAQNSLIAERDATSPPWEIAIQKVENRMEGEIMSEGTKWYLMYKLRSGVALTDLARAKALKFTIPAEKLQAAKRKGTVDMDAASGRSPTHVLSATFRSVVRSTGTDRTDDYFCEFHLTDLRDGTLVWTDSVSFKRAAAGRAWD